MCSFNRQTIDIMTLKPALFLNPVSLEEGFYESIIIITINTDILARRTTSKISGAYEKINIFTFI